MSCLMGIDLGTSSVKALITDEMGNTKGIGQKGYEVQTPVAGYAQQDPEEWWECTKQAVRQAFESAGITGNEIAGIGLSGQMHGMVALDCEKRPAGCEGLLFLPYLAGERTPFNNPLAKGVFMGLSMKHDQAYMVRAVMEGVLFNLRECKKIFDEMKIPQKKVVSWNSAVTEPIPENVRKYQEQQAVFEELYERVEGIFLKL